jgi:conjugative transfer signal peptidase TraF
MKTFMKKRRFALILCGLGVGIYAAGGLAREFGLVINHTMSAPRGLWRVKPLAGPIERGQMVRLCPPDGPAFRLARERGYLTDGRCPGGYEPMLKIVRAIPGDLVEVSAEGVAVNGDLIANSAPLARDRADRALNAMPKGTYAVADGEVWLLSTYNPKSFDSRYFGPVASAQIEGEAAPLWIESQSSVSPASKEARP